MGVYFAINDYVGILRRLAILAIDLVVLFFVYLVVGVPYYIVVGELDGILGLLIAICVWFYLTVIKASKIRTVGYRLTGSRILTLHGTRPSILRMTFRMLLWVLGPFNFLFDLLWSGIDDAHQTLRDGFAGTCVVRNHAKPIGEGEIHLTHYDALGFALQYPRVMRPKPSVSETADET
jgi:uncharacterized RDD family membrane protein YckC